MADVERRKVVGAARGGDEGPRFSQPRDAADWRSIDLARIGAVEALSAELLPERVVNCAALARGAACEADPGLAQRMNADLPRELARWCAAAGARLVHVSTDLVFGAGDAPEGGFDESAPPTPRGVYARTKAEGELGVLAEDPRALVVRLPLLYGNSGGRCLGASDSLLEAVARDEKPPLFEDEWRTPLDVADAALALIELAGREEAGVLHVAGPDRVSRLELGLAVLAAMGLDESLARESVRAARRSELAPERPRDVSLDSRRAAACLDTVLYGVREGTERAAR